MESGTTRKTSIKGLLYLQIEIINNPKTSTFRKAIAMRDFCKLGMWFMRDEIEKDLFKKFSKRFIKFGHRFRNSYLFDEKNHKNPWKMLGYFLTEIHPMTIHKRNIHFSDNGIIVDMDTVKKYENQSTQGYSWEEVVYSNWSIRLVQPFYDWIFETLLDKKVIDLTTQIDVPIDVALPQIKMPETPKPKEDEDE